MSAKAKGKARASTPDAMVISSEGESFDFDNISSSSDNAPSVAPCAVLRGVRARWPPPLAHPRLPRPCAAPRGVHARWPQPLPHPRPPRPCAARRDGHANSPPAPALPTRSSPPKTPRSKPPRAQKHRARVTRQDWRSNIRNRVAARRQSVDRATTTEAEAGPPAQGLAASQGVWTLCPARTAPVRPFHSQAQAGRPLLPRAGPTSPDSGSASSGA